MVLNTPVGYTGHTNPIVCCNGIFKLYTAIEGGVNYPQMYLRFCANSKGYALVFDGKFFNCHHANLHW